MHPTRQFVLQAVSRTGDWVKRLWSAGASLFSQTVTRRRLLVVLATFLVTDYALGVLPYVLAIPEIGLRCAFTPVVNLVFEEFIYPEGQEPIQPGDRVVQLGDQPVDNWPQLLRKLISLRD